MARRTILIAVLGLALLAPGASSAAPAPHIVDAAGDANGINGQGRQETAARLIDERGGVITPLTPDQLKVFDILSVRFSTEFINQRKTAYRTVFVKVGKKRVAKRVAYTIIVKKPWSTLVTVNLAGDPAADSIPKMVRVYFQTGDCVARHQLTWSFTPTNPAGIPEQVGDVKVWTRDASFFRNDCGLGPPETMALPNSKASGGTLVFKIPLTSLAKIGTKINTMTAETRLRPREAYPYPAIDVALSSATSAYSVGK